ncbi:MAG: hypothetical protein KDC67_06130 [Ignavibacteriae bacterium]|nr:hypothetical protein [Ignavibacteriota bacterium]
MKIRPQPTDMPFNEEDVDNFGLYIDWIPSKLGNKTMKRFQARQFIHENDLYDDDIETETRKDSEQLYFTERICPSKLKDMSPKEKAAYMQFILDLRKEQKAESLS